MCFVAKADVVAGACCYILSCMTAEKNVVYENNMITNNAIVCNVNAHHKKIMMTNNSLGAFFSSAMNRTVLTNDIVVANLGISNFTFVT